MCLACPERDEAQDAMPVGDLLAPLREGRVFLDLKSMIDPAKVRPDLPVLEPVMTRCDELVRSRPSRARHDRCFTSSRAA